MKTLQALKSRREGIEKINKISRAMEAIAATRLLRYEKQALDFRPYLSALGSIINNLALRLKRMNSVWTRNLPGDRRGLVVLVSSDRGFCGGFNNQLFQLIKDFQDKESLCFIVIGRKGTVPLKKQHFNIIYESDLPQLNQISNVAQTLTQRVLSFYRDKAQRIELIFNRFRRNLLGRPVVKQLFPLQTQGAAGIFLEYLFEPDIEAALNELLPLYVHSEIKAAILESQASEEMARMVAMTQARRNAEDLIKGITLQYHKARQAGITKELTEIVSAIR